MQPYQVIGEGPSRVLVVLADSLMRYKFWQVVDDKKTEVRFKRSGKKCLAVVSDTVMVYKKPSANEFHYQFMMHSAKANWLGQVVDHDRLVDNLLEYVEAI